MEEPIVSEFPPSQHPTTASNNEHVLLMHPNGYVASAVVLFFIGFFGFFLNLTVIIIMCRDKQLWTPLNLILFNLVCSDFSVSILGNPFTLASSIAHHWIFGSTMCVIYGFFMSLLGITSITSLTVLSFERYLMVSRPLKSQQYLRRKGALFTIGAIWLYSMALTTPPLFGWGEYVNEAANISCSVNWESKTFRSTTYILFLFAFGLVVPVFIITFSYLNIIQILRKQKNNGSRVGRVSKAESRVTFMVAVMIIAFMVAWTPYAVLALLIQFGDANVVSPGIAVLPALVAKSSICYNPVIYVGLNTQFYASWKAMFNIGPSASKGASGINEGPSHFHHSRNNSKILSLTSLDDTETSRIPVKSSLVYVQPSKPKKITNIELKVISINNNLHPNCEEKLTTKTAILLKKFNSAPVSHTQSTCSLHTTNGASISGISRKLSTVYQERSNSCESVIIKSEI